MKYLAQNNLYSWFYLIYTKLLLEKVGYSWEYPGINMAPPLRSAIIRATSVHVVQDERGWAPSLQSAPAHGRPHQIRSHRQTGEAAPLPPSCSARVGNTRRDPGHLLRLPDLTSRRCRNAASRCEREKEGGSEGEMKGAVAPGDYVYFKSIVPLHKISVSSRAPRLPPSHVLSHLSSRFPSRRPGYQGFGY